MFQPQISPPACMHAGRGGIPIPFIEELFSCSRYRLESLRREKAKSVDHPFHFLVAANQCPL
jgi:hypothetical protein